MKKVVVTLYLLLSLAYLASLSFRPYFLDFLVKGVPVLLLIPFVLRYGLGRRRWLIGIGLLFSFIGDTVLAWPGRDLFIYGLSSFLISHLFYIAALCRSLRWRGARLVVALIILLHLVVAGAILTPHLGSLSFPVFAYLTVIAVMGVSAALGSENSFPVILGAYLFILSDIILGIDRFVVPIERVDLWNMLVYYLAQFILVYGITLSFEKRRSLPNQTAR